MLTKRQSELLDFIRDYVARHGYAPAFHEMSAHCRSCSGAMRMLAALEAQGYIRRQHRKARGLEVLDHRAPSPEAVAKGAHQVRLLLGRVPNAAEVARQVYITMQSAA